jgi:hypothetical protein
MDVAEAIGEIKEKIFSPIFAVRRMRKYNQWKKN